MDKPFTNFTRGQGCGNTFIIFDLINSPEKYNQDFLKKAHTILLQEKRDDALILRAKDSSSNHLSLEMVVLEPDFSFAAFCGNGARVVSAYLKKFYAHQYSDFSLIAHDGIHKLYFYPKDNYGVDMLKTKTTINGSMFLKNISKFRQLDTNFFVIDFAVNNKQISCLFTETSEPHLITFDTLSQQELYKLGQKLNFEHRDIFPWGININHVEIKSPNNIKVITYERGVNKITRACGTGSTSSAVLSFLLNKIKYSQINVNVLGGCLSIAYNALISESIMKGTAFIE